MPLSPLVTYVELARSEFKRFSAYPLAVIAGIFTNSIFGLIRGSVLVAAVVGAGGAVAGYTEASALSYVWLGQALLAPIGLWVRRDVSDRVRTGEIAVDLARPVDFQLGWLARDMGRFLFGIPSRGLPTLLIGIILVDIAWPTEWTAYPLGLLSMVIGSALNFLCMYAINLVAFWVVDASGYLNLYGLILNLFSGLLIPVHLFPGWLHTVAVNSPFPSIFQTPIDVLSGRAVGWDAVELILVQLGWLAAVMLLGRLVLAVGTRRLVVQGG